MLDLTKYSEQAIKQQFVNKIEEYVKKENK